MQRLEFLLPALAIAAQCALFADGGRVQLHQESGDLVITVFTEPAQLSAGLVDISVLLQNRKGLDPVLDARISLTLEDSSGTLLTARPTRELAQNKLLYAIPVTISQPGKWRISLVVERNGRTSEVGGVLDVAPAPAKTSSALTYVGFPPLMIALFAIRQQLIRRRRSRGPAGSSK
jgi:hypothetical protein